MTAQLLPVRINAGSHILEGQVDHGRLRLLDCLNDPHSEFLAVQDARLIRGGQESGCEQSEILFLSKVAIDFVMLLEGTHEAPARRNYSYIEKNVYRAFVGMTNHTIEGMLMAKGAADQREILGSTVPLFFAVSEACVEMLHGNAPGSVQHAPVVLVNRTKVAVLQFGRQRLPASPSESNSRLDVLKKYGLY